MKTKTILLVTEIMRSFSNQDLQTFYNNGKTTLKYKLQLLVENEVYKWDYSLLNENLLEAFISFKISASGKFIIEDILTNSQCFKK